MPHEYGKPVATSGRPGISKGVDSDLDLRCPDLHITVWDKAIGRPDILGNGANTDAQKLHQKSKGMES